MSSLLHLSLALLAGTAFVSLFAWSRPRLSTAIGAAGAVAGCAVGLVPAIQALAGAAPVSLEIPWAAPTGALQLGVDPLSAFFLVPLFGLSMLAAVYGRAYLLGHAGGHHRSLAPATAFFNLLVASMAVVVLARGAILFLVAWEVMTLASFLLVSFDHQEAEVRRAAWIYLVAAHAGVICLFAMFLLLGERAGSLSFEAFQTMPALGAGAASAVLLLGALGFGVKAGFLPVHVWLPEAHAAAPSHVSALMSGVLVKLGLYGLLRVSTFVAPPGWWGPLLLILGLCGAFLGIVLALYQRDLKRVLAYSTIENVGLITVGLGLAFWGRSRGAWTMAAAGAGAALLHVWGHAAMKGLMFLGAGSVLTGSGTKDLEKLGGLLKRMPATGLAMVLGAVAIAGLPPLNGFVGEYLLYRGLAGAGLSLGGATGIAAFLGVGALSLVGGLAALCFVRLIGIGLLGEPRSAAARDAHESSPWMTLPLALLVLALLALALAPAAALSAVSPAAQQLFGAELAAHLPPIGRWLTTLGLVDAALLGALLIVGAALFALTRKPAPEVGTWDCGYAAPSARMQYTARSFSELFVGRMVPALLGPKLRVVPPRELFPDEGRFATECADPLTRDVYLPFFARWADRFARLRWLQQGALNVYLVYILVIAVAGLAWLTWRAWGS